MSENRTIPPAVEAHLQVIIDLLPADAEVTLTIKIDGGEVTMTNAEPDEDDAPLGFDMRARGPVMN